MLHGLAHLRRFVAGLLAVLLIAILGLASPAHAIGPTLCVDQCPISIGSDDASPPLVAVFLAPYRAHGPPVDGVFFVVVRIAGHSAWADVDAFGVLIGRTGTTDNRYLYAGEEFVADLGQYYNRARLLDVGTGRFHTRDSVRSHSRRADASNDYLYGNANPENRVDPSGHFSIAETLTAMTLGVTLWNSIILGQTAQRIAKHPYPDALLLSLRGALQSGFGLGFAGGVDVVYYKGRMLAYLAGEVYIDPLAYATKTKRLSFFGAVGGMWNVQSADKISGIGVGATFPLVFNRPLSFFDSNPAYLILPLAWRMALQLNFGNQYSGKYSISFGHSNFFADGPAFVKVQDKLGYSTDIVGWDSSPYDISEIITGMTSEASDKIEQIRALAPVAIVNPMVLFSLMGQ